MVTLVWSYLRPSTQIACSARIARFNMSLNFRFACFDLRRLAWQTGIAPFDLPRLLYQSWTNLQYCSFWLAQGGGKELLVMICLDWLTEAGCFALLAYARDLLSPAASSPTFTIAHFNLSRLAWWTRIGTARFFTCLAWLSRIAQTCHNTCFSEMLLILQLL